MRVVLVGGGTGGHFYPLIAIAESLNETAPGAAGKSLELYYMGPDPYDAAALAEVGAQFISCPAGKRRKYKSLLNFLDIFKVFFGTIVGIWKLFVLYPDVVMSKGGYTSVPVILAARLLRIPVMIHESDATPGRANKLARKFARYVAISYPEAAQFFPAEKTALTGIPMRKALRGSLTEDPRTALGVDTRRPTILILGGSQGAERVNQLVLETLDELLPNFSVVHQTGPESFENIKQSATALIEDEQLLSHYHPSPFMPAATYHIALQAASVVVSRAGSGGIHDIATHGKPSILIPIPEDISHDQRTNAYAYARTGAATVMEEKNLTDGLLSAEITRMMSDQTLYGEMSAAAAKFAPQDAAEKIAAIIISIGNEHE